MGEHADQWGVPVVALTLQPAYDDPAPVFALYSSGRVLYRAEDSDLYSTVALTPAEG